MQITERELRMLVEFPAVEAQVEGVMRASCREPLALIRFLSRYASWNGWFGSGVATLAGKIGRNRALFIDPDEPILALADRSVLVASYFFDAARDEFDDRATIHRDTHRYLAQALLKGTIARAQSSEPRLADAGFVNTLLSPPPWLDALNIRVAQHYGANAADDAASLFRAIGYHLGSEVVTDCEFALIDEIMRREHPELTRALASDRVDIAGQEHTPYQWIAVHSGHGRSADPDRFAWATRGAHLALAYSPHAQHAFLKRQLEIGFIDFSRDHHEFFENVSL